MDGWTLTGDLFEYDTEGVFWSRGRADDLIIRFGINIPPVEIEAKIAEHPSVAECAVVGRFDAERQTNAIIAFVVLKAPDAAIEAGVRENAAQRGNPAFARRAVVGAQDAGPVTSSCRTLPRSGNGKLQRYRLRRRR